MSHRAAIGGENRQYKYYLTNLLMKSIFTRLFANTLAIVFVFSFSNEVSASHAMGVDVNYEFISGNTYKLQVNFYRDCSGITAPAAVTLSIQSPSNCGTSGTVSLTQQGTGTEVSPLCPAQLGNSTCSGGTLPGVEQYVYEANYTFPSQCTDWVISWTHCCRNAAITNLLTPSSQSMYIEAHLDNTGTLDNSAPVFTTLPVPYICVNQMFCYNHGAVDPDGDSLAYSLVNALTTNATAITYVTPNTPTYPMTTSSGVVSFDSLTGSMCVTPSVTQTCVITILVEEYRNGTMIGSTMRDLQVIVQNCTNQQPIDSSGGIQNLTGGALLDSNSVEVCPGDPISFNLVFTDPNPGDNITVTSNVGTAIPGATLNTSGTNPVTVSFSWTPTSFDIGFHQFTLTLQDDGCPILGSQVFAYDIDVLQGTDAGPDLAYCPAGGPVQLAVAGGSSFTWNVLSGDAASLSCTNCSSPLASPNMNTTYEVVSNLSGTCKNKDTITVNLVPDFTLDAGLNDTICKYGTSSLGATATPGTYAPYSYSWSPAATLSSNSVSNPIAAPQSTTQYMLTATSNLGCVITDSVSVVISGVAPIVDAGAGDTVCPGIGSLFVPSVTSECDTSTVGCTGASTTGTVGTGTSSTTTYGPHYMTTSAYSNRKQYLYLASELDAMGFTGGGMITAVALNYSTANSTNSDIRIKMGCTSTSSFPSGTFETGMTLVKNSFSHTPSVGMNTFTLDYPYMWDGTSNLIVEFCTDNLQTGTGSSVSYACSSGVYKCIYANNLNTSGACSDAVGIRTTCRPNMQFTWCSALPPGATISWSPTTALSDPTILNPIASPTSATTYVLNVADGNCVGSDFVTIDIDSTNYVIAAAAPTVACTGDTVQLSAATFGNPVPTPLTCGTNSTTCATSNHIEQVGSGNLSSALYGPFYATNVNQRYGNKVQMILTASELQSSGLTSTGTISQISWDVTTFSGEKFKNIEIKMGCTSQDVYSGSAFITSGLTTVYSSSSQFTVTNGWNTWNITPYDWNGTSNIVIEICTQTHSGNTTPENIRYTAVGANRCIYRHDACNCSACSQTTGTVTANRPNVLLTICDASGGSFNYTWTPTTALDSSNIATPSVQGVTPPTTYAVTVTGGTCTVTDSVTIATCTPLAADELLFTAVAEDEVVRLNWVDLIGKDYRQFQVLRSIDGITFRSIGFQNANAHSAGLQYSMLDVEPLEGQSYYKVRAFEWQGNQAETEAVEIKFHQSLSLSVYPNPVESGGLLNLNFGQSLEGEIDLQIFDIQGRMEREFRGELDGQILSIPCKELPTGVHFIRLRTKKFGILAQKFTVK